MIEHRPRTHRNAFAQNRIARAFGIECLESRTLFTATLNIGAGNVLSYVEGTVGTSNSLTLSVDSANVVHVSDSGSSIVIGTAAANAGWVNNAGAITGPGASISSITIDTTDGFDMVQIVSTHVPVTVSPTQGSSQLVQLGGDPTVGAQGITAMVQVANTSGSTTLSVDDHVETAHQTISIGASVVSGLTAAPFTYGPGVTTLSLSPGGGGATTTIDGTAPNANTFYSTAGNDTIAVHAVGAGGHLSISESTPGDVNTVNLGAAGSVQGILSPITLSNVNGAIDLNIDDSADTAPVTATVGADTLLGSITGLGPGAVTFNPAQLASLTIDAGNGGNAFTFNRVLGPVGGSTIRLNAGGGNNNITVLANPVAGVLDINGEGGADHVTLRAVDPAAINGIVNLANPGGSDVLVLDASVATTPLNASFTDQSATGLVSATVNYANVTDVTVVGGQAADIFDVVPSASAAFHFDGGPSTAAPADTLHLDLTGVAGPVMTVASASNGEQGDYTFTNRMPIAFTRVGAVTPGLGNIFGRAFSAQTGQVLPGVTVFLDANANNTLDAGETQTVTDASGNYHFAMVPAGTVRVALAAPGLVVTTPAAGFASVSLAAGASANGVDLGAVAAPQAGAADLSGSFLTAPPASQIGGTTLKTKLRITNSGAALSGSLVSASVFASPNARLDPSATPIATIAIGKLTLRHGGSKIVSLALPLPAGLAAGSYFLVASLDAANTIAESNKANNVAVSGKAVGIAPPFVDLSGTLGPRLPRAVAARPVSVLVKLNNVGNSPAVGAISVSLFASTDQTFDAGDVPLTKIPGQKINLKPGKSRSLSVRFARPAGLAAGNYFLIAVVNSDQTLTEKTAANNAAVGATAVAFV